MGSKREDSNRTWKNKDNGTSTLVGTEKYQTHCISTLNLSLSLPIDQHRFLLSTHYTHYAPFAFSINLVVTIINLIAKLPVMHQVRLFDINQKVESN